MRIIGEDSQRRDEYTADEWFEVAREAVPGITRLEFDAHWATFAELKAAGRFGKGQA